ncbi:Aromatic di-alanine and TPR containing protein [Ceratobasidium theobromae]|uniref:Aromatic di-alanine and TPR containing protein n=1 Tax=Ceratobasidium theobromae TaxID=1582974 RepID=A0A5N5QIA8_9AGAM|nr:Aromatic di-alanine and TPR containing protein [Ceratobasidium theobromae]
MQRGNDEQESLWWYSLLERLISMRNTLRGGSRSLEDIEAIDSEADKILNQLEQKKTRPSDDRVLGFLRVAARQVGNEFESWFELHGEPRYRDMKIRFEIQAIRLTPEDHPSQSVALFNLSILYQMRYASLDNLEDLEMAISCGYKAVEITPDAHESISTRVSHLGRAYQDRYERLAKLQDIDKAIECLARALSLTPEGHTKLPSLFNELGKAFECRFGHLNKLEDINQAIEYHSQAQSLTPENHQDTPRWLNHLGHAHQFRFGYSGKVEDIDKAIEYHTRVISLTPGDSPSMPQRLNNLANAHQRRFASFGKLEDLGAAIKHLTQAMSLMSPNHKDMPAIVNNLGRAYQHRYAHLGELGDVEKAIQCHSRAVSQSSDGGSDNANRLSSLGNAYLCRFEQLGEPEDIDIAIKFHSQALSHLPKNHANVPALLANLGVAHRFRCERLGGLQDIDRAIECHIQAVSLTPKDHADLRRWMHALSISHQIRFEHLRRLEDIDKSVDLAAQVVTLTPKGHADEPRRLGNLGKAHIVRYTQLEHLEDLERAIVFMSQGVSNVPDGHAEKHEQLNNLANAYQRRFLRTKEQGDINLAIKFHVQAVNVMPKRHANMPRVLNNLANAYMRRFGHLSQKEDLENAIECQIRAVSLSPEGHANIPMLLENLGSAHLCRFEYINDQRSLDSSLECFRKSAQSLVRDPRARFKAACQWANLASAHRPSERLIAYQTAMELVPHLVWLGATITQRYDDIKSIGDRVLEAVAAAIHAQEYSLALEWLEQGRSIVWNQTLQLRTPLDDLSSANAELANKLRLVANELHTASTYFESLSLSDNTTTLEESSQRHRRLAEQYERLIKEVRQIPGFEAFLRPRKASELVCVARSGPVVVINVHTSRCDALVLLPEVNHVVHISLPNMSQAKIIEARSQMEQSLEFQNVRERGGARRPDRPRRREYKDQFEDVLTTLWFDVVKPVLDHFDFKGSSVENLPHITWCTTGPLSFLPLHAAGCYSQPDAALYRFAISSYTPTLTALLPTVHASTSSIRSGVLAIGQEATPGQSRLPETVSELVCIKSHARVPLRYTQIDRHNATMSTVLSAMEYHGWVHLACHAHQDVWDPSESGFFLHDGTLSLAKISQKAFKNKGLAFLSACQTATGDKKLADEAVHLASGMLMAGYPSVIATMWSIMDKDAPLISDLVYGRLLKDGRMNYSCGDVAKALHAAVNELRTKVGDKSFARWVPYVHVGM